MTIKLTGKAAAVADVLASCRARLASSREAFRFAQMDDHYNRDGAELPDVMETPVALWMTLVDTLSALVCVARGHEFEVADFVAAERDECGRIVDIHGGGVEWHCVRCGFSGHSWF